ncbi:peroxiredoxin [Candidatus Gracilibacteria bacterium]|nr:peroxiredoxin [Candidatus Gracilibacteria bacterium]NUJ99094.1 peroxiredoxin [Candidatus Gracilibacteria bacterium]
MDEFIDFQLAKIDTKAPFFELPAYNPQKDEETNISLDSLKGKWVVLFYYPADFTFVCPTELKDMAEKKDFFEKMGVEIFAASTDTIFSHRAWVRHEKLMENFPYCMLSDHNLEVASVYNILDEKTGIAGRGTFVIDPEGIIRVIEITSGPLGRNSDELIRKIAALQYMSNNPGVACPAKWVAGDKTLTPSIKIAGEVFEALNN